MPKYRKEDTRSMGEWEIERKGKESKLEADLREK